MAIDYSKWDKLELSDDSDVEVHPNVDKSSFIRWKQRDIHEKRMQREQQIKGLRVQKEMYTQLNKRVDRMLAEFTDARLESETERNEFLNSNFDKTEKCTLEEQQAADAPTYNEMVEDLFTQITGDLEKEGVELNGANIRKKAEEHRAKVETVLQQIDPKLKEFDLEKHNHITSDDIHEGWNTSFINKSSTAPNPPAGSAKSKDQDKSKNKAVSTAIETINSPTTVKTVEKKPSKPLDELDDLELLKETIEFSKLPTNKACETYLLEHPFIACTHQKDALLMKAFDYQLNGETKKAEDTIRKSMLLQFSADLLENPPNPQMPRDVRLQYVKQLFGQLEKDNTPGWMAYDQECLRMIEHVKTRCEIIKKEQEQEQGGDGEAEGVEQIQLRSVDPSSELVVTVPEKGTKEYEIYEKLPEKMKTALATGSLDEVNKVFATIPIDEAEELLERFNECGVIGIQALLDNEEQFQELAENERKFEQMRKAAEQVNIGDKLNELKEENEEKK